MNMNYQRANSFLRCFVSIKVAVLMRPTLEYNCVVSSPRLKQDIHRLEKVQTIHKEVTVHRTWNIFSITGL